MKSWLAYCSRNRNWKAGFIKDITVKMTYVLCSITKSRRTLVIFVCDISNETYVVYLKVRLQNHDLGFAIKYKDDNSLNGS